MDFLTFKDFISIPVLITFYYFGAIIAPFLIWLLSTWLMKKYKFIDEIQRKGKEAIWDLLSTKQKIKFIAFFSIVFIFIELFWRMLFEFLIAYMQMRDALFG